MPRRKEQLANGEYYHIYNRGVDKRNIFSDKYDVNRFRESMLVFNSTDPVGSIYQFSFKQKEKLRARSSKLVEFVAYSLNPNHYHFLVQQKVENGISTFMRRLGGYTMYFNERNDRNGSLFQGVFKVAHINSDVQLRHVFAYVSLNRWIHGISESDNLTASSWDNINHVDSIAKDISIVKGQFVDMNEFEKFVVESAGISKKRKNKETTNLELGALS
ncbi:hypothetical protein COB55_01255 [Candidatus Wolfebacteria bacterium]|nr:MAG: hypothetical protein COB55_01255 [Candidatus Wolfebacteria bacterium]